MTDQLAGLPSAICSKPPLGRMGEESALSCVGMTVKTEKTIKKDRKTANIGRLRNRYINHHSCLIKMAVNQI
ncbi:hypothetical protein AB4114_24725 [Paenibacillus sp. 2RAB27]|uniref:hypothetical protein n=1 Tax=Paenibacillus sp. 2RAB27 TaxID=3232991 RepID=UPI003F964EA2